MRAASCCRSAASLPWACLMKGCSSKWVTEGRASKSLIRHLEKRTGKFAGCHFPFLIHFKGNGQKPSGHLHIAERSEPVLAPAEPGTGCLKGRFTGLSLTTTWSLSPWSQVQTSPRALLPIRGVQCLHRTAHFCESVLMLMQHQHQQHYHHETQRLRKELELNL